MRGLVRSMLALLAERGVTHVACAFDHVIESFRNGLYPGYKTSAGVPEDLMAQFPLAEEAARAIGVTVWPMVEFEADDAIATAAARFAGDAQIVICSPDKDMAQCVRGSDVVMLDRRRQKVLDERAVVEKFGVGPGSIPDFLALVGDDADGLPGIARWGEKSAARVLSKWLRIENIPDDASRWDVVVRGADALAANLRAGRADAMLYRTLATLRTDVPLPEDLEAMRWRGAPREELRALCERLGEPELVDRVPRFA